MNAVAALLKIDAGAASARALREREFPDLEVALAADDDGIGSSVSSPELFDKGDGGAAPSNARAPTRRAPRTAHRAPRTPTPD
eukprot:3821998-Prymnesium_polylepis.1